MTTILETPAETRPDRSWLVWGGIVVGFLTFTVVTQAILILHATGEPSVAVEPDYYRKAVTWDAHRAQLAKNEALGWKLAVEAGDRTPLGRRELRVRLTDANGAALPDADVRLRAFHKARRSQVLETTCAPGPGGYRTQLPLRRTGRYELRFTVVRGDDRFTQTIEQDLPQ